MSLSRPILTDFEVDCARTIAGLASGSAARAPRAARRVRCVIPFVSRCMVLCLCPCMQSARCCGANKDGRPARARRRGQGDRPGNVRQPRSADWDAGEPASRQGAKALVCAARVCGGGSAVCSFANWRFNCASDPARNCLRGSVSECEFPSRRGLAPKAAGWQVARRHGVDLFSVVRSPIGRPPTGRPHRSTPHRSIAHQTVAHRPPAGCSICRWPVLARSIVALG